MKKDRIFTCIFIDLHYHYANPMDLHIPGEMNLSCSQAYAFRESSLQEPKPDAGELERVNHYSLLLPILQMMQLASKIRCGGFEVLEKDGNGEARLMAIPCEISKFQITSLKIDSDLIGVLDRVRETVKGMIADMDD